MKRWIACFVFSVSVFVGHAQKKRLQPTPYAANIIKVTALPGRSDWHNENISDAVILKPARSAGSPQFKWSGGQLFINEKLRLSYFDSGSFSGLHISLVAGEKIYGGGERALPLNRRGYRLNLYNNPWYGYGEGADNLNYSVPFFTSSEGYGLFFDNPSKGYVDVGKSNPDVLEYSTSAGEVNVYIVFGDYKTILQSYYKLTGTQPLPPRWAFGHFMSRFGYTSEAQVKDIYQKTKQQGLPVDAVIFDLFWFGDNIKGTMGNLDWVNKTAWPNPKKMMTDFKKEGVQPILVTEPFFVETSKNYVASKPFLAVDSANQPYYLTDFYFGKGGLVDIFRKDAQGWFWRFYKAQMLNGVEAWWGDLGEPEKHPSDLYHNVKDLGQNRLFAANEVHNIYGHHWTKMLYSFYAKEYPAKRLFSLNRSGFAGTQRYSIFPWTGDVSRSWSGLRAQLPVLLGMSMSGVPYVHSDAGGFAGGKGDVELYVRWLQFAAYTPIFRPHGTALYKVDTSAFSFPSEAVLIDAPYRDLASHVILQRYRMLPYNYSLAYQQAQYGKPLMAPLYYHFPNDTTAASVQDQYMWGENLMVVPVLEQGSSTRTYYLPKGRWYHMHEGKMLEGAGWQTDSVNLSFIPVLAKEGSFVPADGRRHVSNTSFNRFDSLEVMYVPSSTPSTYQLFQDDGLTKGSIETKAFELLTFSSSGKSAHRLLLKITSNGGHYAGKPGKRNIVFRIPQTPMPKSVWMNGKMMAKQKSLKMEQGGLVLPVAFSGAPIEVKLVW